MNRIHLLLIGCLAVVLAAILTQETTSNAGMTTQPAVSTPVETVRAAVARAPPSMPRTSAAVLLARPLFEPTRRPPASAIAPTTLIAAAVPRVTGVLIGPGDRSAIFAAGDNGRQVVAREGARVGAFTVQSIRIGQVTVVGPDGPITLRPSFDPNQRVERSVPPPPPPPPASITSIPGLPVAPTGPVGRFGLPSLPGLPAAPAVADQTR